MPLDERSLSTLVVVIVVAVVLLGAWVAWMQRGAVVLRRRMRAVFAGAGDRGLDELLDDILRRLDRNDERIGALSSLQQELEALLRRGTVRNVGLVRFNPFPDAGGDQSFAIALLDAEGTGVVLSSLYARSDTRVFAKPVHAGRSRYPLSDEEQDAIRQAMSPAGRAG